VPGAVCHKWSRVVLLPACFLVSGHLDTHRRARQAGTECAWRRGCCDIKTCGGAERQPVCCGSSGMDCQQWYGLPSAVGVLLCREAPPDTRFWAGWLQPRLLE